MLLTMLQRRGFSFSFVLGSGWLCFARCFTDALPNVFKGFTGGVLGYLLMRLAIA